MAWRRGCRPVPTNVSKDFGIDRVPGMIEGHCHCKSVRVGIARAPETVGDCNCSVCSRLGVLWGYFETPEVVVRDEGGTLVGYVQGERTLTIHHCRVCGCTTHWSPLPPASTRMAVNMRLFDRSVWEHIPRRFIDGARW